MKHLGRFRKLMNVVKKYASAALGAVLFASLLVGCGKEKEKDPAPVQETAEQFLDALKTGDENSIITYSNSEVAKGYFVTLFNANALEEQFASNLDKSLVREDTQAKMDEFYNIYTSMMEGYTISDVEFNEDGTATVYGSIKTSFPMDVITSDEAKAKINEATNKYNEDTMAEIVKMRKDEGEDAAFVKISNDLIIVAMDVYEDVISSSTPKTYSISLTLEENEEDHTWRVTDIQNSDGKPQSAASSDGKSGSSKSDDSNKDISAVGVSFEKLEELELENASGASASD